MVRDFSVAAPRADRCNVGMGARQHGRADVRDRPGRDHQAFWDHRCNRRILNSLTLMSSAAGGILFGILADRFGRTWSMMASILVYSIFTALCGFSQTITQLAVFRLLLGLGIGGEWSAGAALISEHGPTSIAARRSGSCRVDLQSDMRWLRW